VGHALGVAVRAATADAMAEHVLRALRERAGETVVLDEIENLDRGGLQLVGRLAETGVTVVATTRVRPRLTREHLVVLSPLDYPADDDVERARRSDSVRLFVERAQSAGALPEVTGEVLEQVAAICRRLGGLPLAVELAASRSSSIGLRRLRRELDASIDGVGTPAVDAPPGHATIRGAVKSSIERLGPSARAMLEAAALLPQAFELEQLEALLGQGADPLDDLQTLLDHSMVAARPGPEPTELRFSVHAVVRDVALTEATEARRAALDTTHAAWRAAEAAALADDRSSRAFSKTANVEPELTRAWAWTMARLDAPGAPSAATDLARALGRLVEQLGPAPTTSDLLDRTSEMAERRGVDAARRAELALYRGFARLAQSELELAKALYAEARTLAAAGNNPRFEALAGVQLAWLAMRDGDVPTAEAALARASQVLEPTPDPFPDLLIASLRGQMDLQRGRLATARRGFERARALAVRLGDGGNEASASGFLGAVAFDEGAPREAVRHYDRAIAIAGEHRASIMEAVFRGYRAIALHRLGSPEAGAAYEEAIEHARRSRSVRFEVLFSTWRGVLLAEAGDVEGAGRAIDAADGLPDPQVRAVCALQRGHVDLARADRALREGRVDEARRHEARACSRLGKVRDDASTLRELRVVRRHLEDAIARRPMDAGDASLVFGWQASWVSHDGERIELQSRGPLRRLVWALALRRIVEPGVPADVPSLVAAAWPEENVRPASAVHRLHVALSTLRRLGLRDAIESIDGGYRITPTRTVGLSRRP
jgi:tetratricopeptide (TPR) repeat protein